MDRQVGASLLCPELVGRTAERRVLETRIAAASGVLVDDVADGNTPRAREVALG